MDYPAIGTDNTNTVLLFLLGLNVSTMLSPVEKFGQVLSFCVCVLFSMEYELFLHEICWPGTLGAGD